DTDVTAATLALAAATGIGTATQPLQTVVSNLTAKTTTGGIFISNTGNLAINGGIIAGVNGVQDTGASGDIQLTNAGNINIVTFNDVIQGPANVTVTATGAGGNILAASNNGGLTPPLVASTVPTGAPAP